MPTRVLTPGLLAGIRPVSNAREVTTFDLGLYGGADVRPVTGIRDPSYGVDIPLPPAPRLLPAAIQQNPMHWWVILCEQLNGFLVGYEARRFSQLHLRCFNLITARERAHPARTSPSLGAHAELQAHYRQCRLRPPRGSKT